MEIQRVRVNRNLWKTNLTREITHLEDALDQVYLWVGLKPRRVVSEDETDEGTLTTKDKRSIGGDFQGNFEHAIDEQVSEIGQAADNICALISSVTEFDLPIPVLVLLRIAARVGSVRCSDFSKKVPGSLAKRYIHTKKCLDLIESSLLMHKWISIILGTNILPFQAHINQNVINLLEWTRTSNLCKHDEARFYSIRSQALGIIIAASEQLSLNMNLDSRQLESLLDSELIQALEVDLLDVKPVGLAAAINPGATSNNSLRQKRMLTDDVNRPEQTLRDKYLSQALVCLDRLFVVYADYLGAKLESRLKGFIIQTSIRIYRDFERANVIGLANRRLLLRLLETISNRPYATSTSELAWHIFELAGRLESDPEVRYLCRRAVKFGLAHRPIVVSHFDVFDCQVSVLRSVGQGESIAPAESNMPTESIGDTTEKVVEPEAAVEKSGGDVVSRSNGMPVSETPSANIKEACSAPVEISAPATSIAPENISGHSAGSAPPQAASTTEENPNPVLARATQQDGGIVQQETTITSASSPRKSIASVALVDSDDNGVDEQVQSYLDLFVDKPATTLLEPSQSANDDTNGQPLLNKP